MADTQTFEEFNIGHYFNVATITNVVSKETTFGIKVSKAYVDKLGAVITGNYIMNVLDPSNNNVERIYVPANATTDGLTIGVETTAEVTRGLKPTGMDKTDGSSDYAFKLKPGMIVAISVDPIIMNEVQAALLGEISSKIKLAANPTFDAGITIAPNTYATVAARNAAIPSPSDWVLAGVDDTGMTMYNPTTAQWEVLDTGTPTPNASETVSGKVELATVAEQGLATSLGGSGARLVLANSNLIKTSSGNGDENKIGVLNALGQWADGFISSAIARVSQLSGLSSADATALTNGATTTLHKHDTYLDSNAIITDSYDLSTASGTTVLPHGLGKIPKLVMIQGISSSTLDSFGSSNGTVNQCVYRESTSINRSIIYAIRFGTTNTQWATVTLDDTNVTLNWTKTNSPTGIAELILTVFA